MGLLEIRVRREPEIVSDDVRTDAAERVWADRIRAGDMQAFESLYRAYWQRLHAFAFRYVHSQEDAEDVTQEVFLRIWRGRAHWLPAGPVRNYLYLSVRNAARDRVARVGVAERWRVRQAVPASAVQPDLANAELAATVEEALAELPSKRAAVCRLRLIDGLRYAQIAERLGISEKTVETQLARGLKFLRDRLRQIQ